MSEKLYISELFLKNYRGLRNLRMACGPVVEVSGRNGTGKSSIAEGVKAGLGGGNIDEDRTVGAEEPAEIHMNLGEGLHPRYRIVRKGKKLVVNERLGDSTAYEPVKKPQEFLDSLHDKHLIDPLKWVTADGKQQTDLFLQALPVTIELEALRDALGDEKYALVQTTAEQGGHPFQMLTACHEVLYALRHGKNVTLRKVKDSAGELRKSVPPDLEESGAEALSALEAERDEVARVVTDARAKAESQYREAAAGADSNHKTFTARRREKLEQDIAILRAEAEADIFNDRQATDEVKKHAEAARTEALSEIQAEQERLDGLTQRLSKARSDAQNLTRLKTLQEQAEKFEKEAAELEGQANGLTTALETIDRLKMELLAAAPVDGLKVAEGGITIHDVPLAKLNKGQRVELAASVSMLRGVKRGIPIVVLDEAEALDEENRQKFIERCEAGGIQVFFTYVSKSPELEVR